LAEKKTSSKMVVNEGAEDGAGSDHEKVKIEE
jgi:hypothetical protein